MMDSLTRVAIAQREVGLATGEPPVARGYTPSVFAMLPRLLERSGCSEISSITAIYTVLVEGDEMNEPISDAVRGILDGHVVLSRKLAQSNHFPAIDILHSISRVMPDIVDEAHMEKASAVRNIMSDYEEARDLINIGAYKKGSNKKIDLAISRIDGINKFLKQGMREEINHEESMKAFMNLV
jgi:flagellum-specific ATP synthase